MSRRTPTPRASSTRRQKSLKDASRSRAIRRGDGDYWTTSTRPLHILVFLLPLIVLYEVGSAWYLANDLEGTRQTIEAHKLFGSFFQNFGLFGLFLPGVALATVLFVWHILLGDRWRVRPAYLGGMAVESAAWTLPLLVMGAIFSRAAAHHAGIWPATEGGGTGAGLLAAAQSTGTDRLMELSWQARLTISIGAGLYEEMLFRLVLIAGLHLILHDLALMRNDWANTLCVIVSAVLFALYHDTRLADGSIDTPRLLFFFAAGLYFGAVFVLRGLGVTVGCHALYDVVALLGPG